MLVAFSSDVSTTKLIERSEEDFNNADRIIKAALKADLLAIGEVENFLNAKCVFLEAKADLVYWEQDMAHDQMRYHFVFTDKRDGRDFWSASDARYVRTRLPELVKILSTQLQALKTVF